MVIGQKHPSSIMMCKAFALMTQCYELSSSDCGCYGARPLMTTKIAFLGSHFTAQNIVTWNLKDFTGW